MKYSYYPGCSLEGTAQEYDAATRALFSALDCELDELSGWTCCGASAAEATSYLLSLALPARNLAVAEQSENPADLLVPCSACYLNLKKAAEKIKTSVEIRQKINALLAVEHMTVQGRVPVRHLLDVLSRDFDSAFIRDRMVRTFTNVTIAPYYGCQCLRPYIVFDDPETPDSMSGLIRATGAEPLEWQMGNVCCGASHVQTDPSHGLRLVADILHAARKADAIVTVCPMCQMNLEAYQSRIMRETPDVTPVTILYLPQFLGLAMGIDVSALKLEMNLAITPAFRNKVLAGCMAENV